MHELLEGLNYLKKGAMLNLVAIGLMFISLLYMGLTVGFVSNILKLQEVSEDEFLKF